LAIWPAWTVTLDGETSTLKSVAEPESETVCEPPGTSSVMVSAPLLIPPVLGTKLTLIAQAELAGRIAGQLLVWMKSPAIPMEAMFTGNGPGLLSVTALLPLCVPTGTIPNVKVPVVTLSVGTAPVPESDIGSEL